MDKVGQNAEYVAQIRVLLLPLAPAGLSAILSLPIEAHPLNFRVLDARLRTHRRALV
jgi:hypothetical protein